MHTLKKTDWCANTKRSNNSRKSLQGGGYKKVQQTHLYAGKLKDGLFSV